MSDFRKYRNKFSKERLAQKVNNTFGKLGQKVVYTVLLLYYAYGNKDTPSWAKNIIIGALGYFLSPIDAIPDLSPFLGYTDDIGILSFGLVTIACYITDTVRSQAEQKLKSFFGVVDETVIAEVNKTL